MPLLPVTADPAIALKNARTERRHLAVSFTFSQYYLPGNVELTLAVIAMPGDGGDYVMLVTDQVDACELWLAAGGNHYAQLTALAQAVSAPLITYGKPWILDPVFIAKPWGQEIWYTGIEERGQSGVSDGRSSIPLPWLLALGGELFLGGPFAAPNLLKILDPLPAPVYGDLYFELHEKKQEVYVITHVDKSAWPDGRGAIRFGFDEIRRNEYGSDNAFREAFHEAVKNYETVRRSIDAELDQLRLQEGIGINEPVSPQQLQHWLATLPDHLLEQEAALRQAMNSFTAMVPLTVGDVVKVPTLVPHALQHGVRTVEFQTPVYERKILSFAQKVLTQQHWDTEAAIEQMVLDAGSVEALSVLQRSDGVLLEEVVRFDDFQVMRLTLNQGSSWAISTSTYFLCMGVIGQGVASGQKILPEQALLVPAVVNQLQIENCDDEPMVVLLARPC